MKQLMTKILSLALVVVLCVSVMPLNIFAADTLTCYYCKSTNVAYVATIDATCTESGGKVYFCNDCEKNFIDSFVEPLGHDLKEKTPGTAPSCTATGTTAEMACTRCDYVVPSTSVDMVDHDYVVEIVEPVCGVSDGLKTTTCANCDYKKEEVLPKEEHSWVVVGDENIGCNVEGDGKVLFECELCGEKKELDYKNYDHVWGEWEAVKDATCAEAGEEKRTCVNCGEVETKELPKEDHKYDAGKVTTEPTCTAEGVKTFTCEGCGDTYTEAIAKLDHQQELKEAVAATCTVAGKKAHVTCKTCDTIWAEDGVTVITAADIDEVFENPDGTKTNFKHEWSSERVVDATTCGGVKTTLYACNCGETCLFQEVIIHLGALAATAAEEATCTTDGNSAYWYCADCDKYFSDDKGTLEIKKDSWVIKATAHAGYETVAAVAPTCNAEGNIKYVSCKTCGKYFTDNTFKTEIALADTVVPATGAHVFTNYVVTLEPTCTTPGAKEAVCDKCGVVKDTIAIDVVADAHVATDKGTYVDVPCTVGPDAVSYTEHVCKECGVTYRINDDKPAHNFNDVYEAEEPTCTTDGWERYRCEDCGEYEGVTHVVPALGHDWDEGVTVVEDTCTGKGSIKYTCKVCTSEKIEEIDAISDHDYTGVVGTLKSEATCNAKAVYTYKCNLCGETEDKEEGEFDLTKHKYDDGVVTTEPTCTAVGVKTFTCSVCGGTKTEDVAMIPHTTTAVEAVADTCTAPGYAAHWECTACGKLFTDEAATTETTLEALKIDLLKNHVYAYTPDDHDAFNKDSNCTDYGYTYWLCLFCDADYLVGIAPTGHTMVKEDAVSPTCTKPGHTATIYCDKCDYVELAPVEIPALGGHVNAAGEAISDDCTDAANVLVTDRVCVLCTETINYEHDELTFTVPASCSAFEYVLTQCNTCHKVLSKEITGNEYGAHVFDPDSEIIVDKAPTCTAPGEGHRNCTLCGAASEAIEVPAAGHKYGDPVVVEATCTAAGSKTYTCSVCTHEKVEEIAQLTHNYVEDTEASVAPTYIAPGKKVEKCTLCGDVKETELPALAAVNFSIEYQNGNKNAAEYNVVNGGILEVVVKMEAFQKDAANLKFSFKYDTSVLTFVSAEANYQIFDEILANGNNNTGVFTVFANNAKGELDVIDGATTLVTLRFKVATLDNVFEVVGSSNSYTTSLTDFSAEILKDTNTELLYNAPVSEQIVISKLGAVHNDNFISNADVIVIKDMIKAGQFKAEADIDMDGDVDADDYLYIIKYIIGAYDYAGFVGVSAK